MVSDTHFFSDTETEHEMDFCSNLLADDEDEPDGSAEGAAESAWAHPYEDMELITPPAKIELRDFPVCLLEDLEHAAKAACKQEQNTPHGESGSQQGEGSSAAPKVIRQLGKGSWTIKVTQGGGVGRVAHRENPGPESRAILPCVDREGAGEVLVGALGGRGWDFSEVGRSDKRAMSLLWPKEKCVGSVAKSSGKARLPEVDLADMTPEERLQRERRDEKNRKERERRAQQKIEKQRLAKEAELAQNAAPPAGPTTAQCACAPGTPAPGMSAPGTPAPGTPNTLMSEAGTPQAPAQAHNLQGVMDVDANSIHTAKDATATSHSDRTVASSSSAAPAARPAAAPVSGRSIHLSAQAAPPANQPTSSASSASPPTSAGGAQVSLPTTSNDTTLQPAAVGPVSTPALPRTSPAANAQTFAAPPSPCPAPVSAASTRPYPYAGKKVPTQAPPAVSPVMKAATAASPAGVAASANGPPAIAREALTTDTSVPSGKVAVSAVAAPTAPNPSPSLAALPAPLIERGRYDGERIPPGGLFQVTAAAVAMLPGKVAAPIEVAPKSPKGVLCAPSVKVSRATPPLSPKRPSAIPAASKDVVPKDGDEVMKEVTVRADKENLQDDDTGVAVAQDRGRVASLEETDAKKLSSKRRRPADLSPVNVEVNCRAGETKRAARARGVQRA
jgi:hypothetical protein